VPADISSPAWFGVLVHLGGPLLSIPILAAVGMSWVNTVVVMGGLGFLSFFVAEMAARLQPAAELPPLERAALLKHICWDIVAKGFGVGGLVLLLGCGASMALLPAESRSTGPWQMLVALAFCDVWYYTLHRFLMHGKGQGAAVRFARREHGVHHRVSALDFFRGNQGSLLDNGVISFPLPLILVSTALGMSPAAITWVYMVLMMVQITHHVNHTFSIGLLRLVVLDSHAHKMHHCAKGQMVNFAAVFAVWDRAFGTYYEDAELNPIYMHTHKIPLPIRAQGRRRA